jgi:AAA domain
LTGEPVHRTGPVWIHNNEDSLEELYRRISGVLNFHRIELDSVRQNIFVSSGLDNRLIVAVKDKDIVKRTEAVKDVIAAIKENGICHIVIDPLVSTHRGVSENSNEEIEQVAEAIRHIAHETGCSIDLVHHSIKSHAGNSESHAGDMNAARGASALIGAVRIIYTLSPMSAKTATTLKVPPHVSARLVRLDQGKGNYTARDPSIRWFELVGVPVGNGIDAGDGFMVESDTVAVPVPWKPTVAEGESTRDDVKNGDPKQTEWQHVRDFLAKAMQTDRVELSSLIKVMRQEFCIGRTAARNRVMKAVPRDQGGFAQADGASYRLTIEREEPSPPNPVFLIRTIVSADDENGAVEAVTSVVAITAAVSERARGTTASEVAVTDVDAPADLVPA